VQRFGEGVGGLLAEALEDLAGAEVDGCVGVGHASAT
jgi:hypothetical protein